MTGLKWATLFGAAEFLKFLVETISMEDIQENIIHELIMNAVKSDCHKTFRIVLGLSATIPQDVLDEIRDRGNTFMNNLTTVTSEDDTEEKKKVSKLQFFRKMLICSS